MSLLGLRAGLPVWLDSLPRHFTAVFAAAVFLLVLAVSVRPTSPERAPALSERIPYFSNAYQYMTDLSTLLALVR